MPRDLSSIYDDPSILNKADDASMIVLENWWHSDQEFVDPMRGKVEDWYNLYRNYIEIDDDSVNSNFHIPLAHSHIESYLPRLVANRPRTEVYGRSPDDERYAAMQRALLFEQWQSLEMPMIVILWAKAALYSGIGYVKVGHRKRSAIRMVRRPKNPVGLDPNDPEGFLNAIRQGALRMFGRQEGEDISSFIEREQIVENNAFVENKDFDELFPTPGCTSLADSPWIVDEYKETLSNLESLRFDGRKLYDEKVVGEIQKRARKHNPYEDHHAKSNTLRQRRLETFGAGIRPTTDVSQREVTLLERWTDDKVTTVVAEFPDLPPIRSDRNVFGFKPYEEYVPIPLQNELLGVSVCETLYSINLELDALHNARMDHLLSSVHRMFYVLTTSNINPASLRMRPNGIIPVDEMGEIQEVPTNELQFSLYRESEELRRWAAQGTGATDPFIGLQGRGGAGTATEASLLAQSSGTRAGLMFDLLSLSLTRLAKKLIRINALFMDTERIVRVVGPEFELPEGVESEVLIDPDLMALKSGVDLDVIIDVAATEPETRQFRLQRAINGIGAVSQIPTEQFANPVMKRLLVQLLQGLGDEYGHQVVEQMAGIANQMMQAQGAGTLGIGGPEAAGGNGAGTVDDRGAALDQQLSAVLGADAGGSPI